MHAACILLAASLFCFVGVQPLRTPWSLSSASLCPKAQRTSLRYSFRRYSQVSLEDGDKGSTKKKSVEKRPENLSVLSATALIAGTTIGGGFLALPYYTAPAGLRPAVIGLGGCWLYLLMCSYALVDAVLAVKNARGIAEISTHHNLDKAAGDPQVDDGGVSIFAVTNASLGGSMTAVTSAMFCVLMLATMVAQMSKIGTVLSSIGVFSEVPKGLLTAASTVFFAIICFAFKKQSIDSINTFLTSSMLLSFGSIGVAAARVGLDLSALRRVDYSQLMPVAGRSTQWAIPIYLQLLVYTEIVTLICDRMNDRRDIRKSLLVGSLVPLFMCVLWTAISLGLVPFQPNLMVDPINVLLESSTPGLSNSLLVFALSAMSTTIIGSFLACRQFFQDILSPYRKKFPKNWLIRSAPEALTMIPPTAVAALGSPSLYYLATNFAGAFPVTFLWGLLPPLAYLALQKKNIIRNSSKMQTATNMALVATSALMLSLNVLLSLK